MNVQSGQLPDLLRRFTETPHAFCTEEGDNSLRVETNDPAILVEFVSQIERFPRSYSWKIIRDDTMSTSRQAMALSFGPLTAVLLGAETLVIVDHERREVLGFLAADVSLREALHCLTPIFSDDALLEQREDPDYLLKGDKP
jgi:hypothetical protein